MNLENFMEEKDYAFYVVCSILVLAMMVFFAGLAKKFQKLEADTTSAQSFTLLKNFFTYVEDLEYHVFSKRIEKPEFKVVVEKITGLKITGPESDFLFQMVDANKDCIMDTNNELQF